MDFLTPTYKYSLNNHFDSCIPRSLVGSLITQFTQIQTIVQYTTWTYVGNIFLIQTLNASLCCRDLHLIAPSDTRRPSPSLLYSSSAQKPETQLKCHHALHLLLEFPFL